MTDSSKSRNIGYIKEEATHINEKYDKLMSGDLSLDEFWKYSRPILDKLTGYKQYKDIIGNNASNELKDLSLNISNNLIYYQNQVNLVGEHDLIVLKTKIMKTMGQVVDKLETLSHNDFEGHSTDVQNNHGEKPHSQNPFFRSKKFLMIMAVIATGIVITTLYYLVPTPHPTPPIENLRPVVKILTPQRVSPGSIVTLDGTPSKDPDGKIMSYYWTQSGGPHVILDGANTEIATFTAPNVSSEDELMFNLRVVDDKGRTSYPGTAVITIQALSQSPPNSTGTIKPSQKNNTLQPDFTAVNQVLKNPESRDKNFKLNVTGANKNEVLTYTIIKKPTHGNITNFDSPHGVGIYHPLVLGDSGFSYFSSQDSFSFMATNSKGVNSSIGTINIENKRLLP